MRVTDMDLAAVDLPLERPLRTAIHDIRSVSCLLVTLRTDDGLTGEGYAFCFGMERLRAIAAVVESLRPVVVGQDPLQPEALWQKLFHSLHFFGQSGLSAIAMTPIDVACWDLVGKMAGQPLYRLFGAYRDRVPAYASGGLWLSSDTDELQAESKAFVEQGFHRVKLRLGSGRWQDDMARIEAVREAIGPHVGLMVDANQGLTQDAALRLGRALDDYELIWFEEPVPTWNDAASAAVAAAIDTPLASGESEYLRYGLRRQIENRSADILMPDLQRMGGYSEFLKAVGLMSAYDMRFSPHIFTEHSLHLVASSPNALYVEHMPWFGALFQEDLTLDAQGAFALPERPGVGFNFDWEGLDSHRVAL
ncbi:mandelate racemase/muconate lactonizing enzyme family protein [Aquisalimonas lutea]|uniref:mandelate racemase/muconate lactonizing enzyme family protein n=1 Tax=Aquisalimonas lutea TaxID=1327750 RepID=UPI0025B4D214|nr:mandelate racemase/muconate lactonizing enzyme family protein [Aquisalimonas lutea]MDN3517551.1 mandelate racemase/muconate lactonizing enzyme family protein [Aquisalimonas lutea]